MRAVRYYRGAYTIKDLANLPTCITQWALCAEAAESDAEQIAADLAAQRRELRGNGN